MLTKIFIGEIYGGLNMMNLYKYTEKEQKEILESMTILIDTREKQGHVAQWCERKKKPFKIKKLNYGDYAFFIPKNEKLNIPRDMYFAELICVERKASLEEVALNFTKDRARIEKEFALYTGRMKLLIENATYKDIRDGNYKSKYGRESFLGTLHSFEHKYGVSFQFMPHNDDTPLYIYLYFRHYLRNYLK